MSQPPLRFLHPSASLVGAKMDVFRKIGTEDLIASLRPGTPGALKARPDGTVLDGHHRLRVLLERNVDIDRLPREVLDHDLPPGYEAP